MRCEDVTQRLSCSTGSKPDPAIAAHIAACPRCAAWANQCRLQDQAWDLSRTQPASNAFERTWARVEHSSATGTLNGARRPTADVLGRVPFFQRPRLLLASLAAAAALALTWAGLSRVLMPPRSHDLSTMAQAEIPKVEAESGETLYIHIGERQMTTESQPFAMVSDNETIAAEHDLFNQMESLGAG